MNIVNNMSNNNNDNAPFILNNNNNITNNITNNRMSDSPKQVMHWYVYADKNTKSNYSNGPKFIIQ